MKKKIIISLLFVLCLLFISACGNRAVTHDTGNVRDYSQIEETPESRDREENKDNTGNEAQTSNEEKRPDSTPKDTKSKDADKNEKLVDGMRPEFKEAMDSYEEFYDEYCKIMKKYTKNPYDMEILADYTDMLTKSAEMSEKFAAWENSDLNSAELKYYLDVNNRVTKKLLELTE